MSNIKGVKFKDNTNGNTFTVTTVFDNIAFLDNKSKIEINKLLNSGRFSPISGNTQNNRMYESNNTVNYTNESVIDPNKFGNNSWIGNISNDLSRINPNNIPDNVNSNPVVKMDNRAGAPNLAPGEKQQMFNNNQSQQHFPKQQENITHIQEDDPEAAKKALLEKYKSQQQSAGEAARKQFENLKRYMDEDEIKNSSPPVDILPNDPGDLQEIPKDDPERPKITIIEPEDVMEEIQKEEDYIEVKKPVEKTHKKVENEKSKEDPILTVFSNAKRNYNFDVDIQINEMIPNPNFIALMEDSYNTSMIEYLAEEFTRKIIEDPDFIKNKIEEELKKLVYKNNE